MKMSEWYNRIIDERAIASDNRIITVKWANEMSE